MSAEESNEPLLLLSDNKASCNADVEDEHHIPAPLVSAIFSFLVLDFFCPRCLVPCVVSSVFCLLSSVRVNNLHHHDLLIDLDFLDPDLDLDLLDPDLDLDLTLLDLNLTLT